MPKWLLLEIAYTQYGKIPKDRIHLNLIVSHLLLLILFIIKIKIMIYTSEKAQMVESPLGRILILAIVQVSQNIHKQLLSGIMYIQSAKEISFIKSVDAGSTFDKTIKISNNTLSRTEFYNVIVDPGNGQILSSEESSQKEIEEMHLKHSAAVVEDAGSGVGGYGLRALRHQQ